jgi:hypothetical protein
MEGLRVHPDVRDRGVASHIHNYVLETWRKLGRGVIRLTTGSYNVKIHQMCERSGFKRIAEFIPYRAQKLMEETTSFNPLEPDEAQAAMDLVQGNPVHGMSAGLINLGWVFADPQMKHIQDAIKAGHAWWWKGGKGFLTIWEDGEDERHEPGIQLVACPEGDLCELLQDYRRLVASLGYESAGWVAPNYPQVLSCLEQAGYKRTWDVSLYIFELWA